MSTTDDDGERPRYSTRPTVQLDPAGMKATWPIVIASLEQLGDWTILALRLGVLALINNCVRELALPSAKPELVNKLRHFVEVLAHIPFER